MIYTEPTPEERSFILKTSNATERLVEKRERREITPEADTTVWRLIQDGEFPRPVKLTNKRSAWRVSSLLWRMHCLCIESNKQSIHVESEVQQGALTPQD